MRRIAVTLGDPAGIGPEVVDAALNSGQLPEGVEWKILGHRDGIEAGKPSRASATIAWEALQESVRLLKNDEVDAVVTGPVSKDGLQSLDFKHPGQTEYFAEAFGVEDYGMLLTGERLSVGLATIHEPLAKIASMLSQEKISSIARLTANFLTKRRINRPRIAICGLNPHAGENGRFGNEEEHIITPAIEELAALDIADFSGPHVPDAVFRDAAEGKFDAVIAMYHDQGLIPLKLLDFDSAVNVTLGLPKPRTSPDHGTAYQIAGKGIAKPSSMIAAMKLAADLCQD